MVMPEVQWRYLLYDAISVRVFFPAASVLTCFLKSFGYGAYIAIDGIVKRLLLEEYPRGSWIAGLEPG